MTSPSSSFLTFPDLRERFLLPGAGVEGGLDNCCVVEVASLPFAGDNAAFATEDLVVRAMVVQCLVLNGMRHTDVCESVKEEAISRGRCKSTLATSGSIVFDLRKVDGHF